MHTDFSCKLFSLVWDRNQLLGALECLTEFLRSQQLESAYGVLGWGWQFPIDDLWKDEEIPAGDLVRFIQSAEAAGNGKLGASDVVVESLDRSFQLLFKHESYVIGEFASEEGLKAFQNFFEARNLRFERAL